MASPMADSRIEPQKKAHFTLHISDRIAKSDDVSGSYSAVKYNHKPAQTSDTRSTTLSSPSDSITTGAYNLKLEDKRGSGDKDIFTFTGQRTAPKKSYVLLFDPSTQRATLEPLTDTYTFNLGSKNTADISAQYPKIYPKKLKDDTTTKASANNDEDLFGDPTDDEGNDEPDADNPYDFRHFLPKEKEKRGDESEYGVASPDSRSLVGTPLAGAATPIMSTARPEKPVKPTRPEPVPKKRKTAPVAKANPMVSKPIRKKAEAAPVVRLERRATEQKPESSISDVSKATTGKIKSAELVHSSDESDAPSPGGQDEYAEGESDDGGLDLEIEVPDARPARPRQNLGANVGMQGLRSPSNGPISLASATNSPNLHAFSSRNNHHEEEIDFGDLGADEDAEGEDEDDYEGRDDGEGEGDGDVEPMDIGPPVHRRSTAGVADEDGDGDEDDPLYKEMMEGLAGGDSSEESEEE